MWQKASYLSGALFAVTIATSFAPVTGGFFSARAESFDARWTAFRSTQKEDRLAPPRRDLTVETFAYTDPGAQTTVLKKVQVARKEKDASPVRELPRDTVRKEKMPIGCEPSFSPVAVPSMAGVTGRCLAERESDRKVANLAR
jgi:hypothetical protein